MKNRFGFIAQSLFFATVGSVILTFMGVAIHKGAISWGNTGAEKQISSQDAPIVFWLVISLGILFGGTVAIGNLRNAIKVAKRRPASQKRD